MYFSRFSKRKFHLFSKKIDSIKSKKSHYELAVENYKKNYAKEERRKNLFKYSYYLLGISLGCFYINYISKASGLSKSLKIDKKYEEHVKNTQVKHNINQEKIDSMIKKFDDKYQINKKIDDREERLKYGNKALNQRTTELKKQEDSSNAQNFNNEIITIDLNTKQNREKEILIQEYNNSGESLIYTKNKEFEQIKILQGTEEDNLDPRIMGNTIIFDSRFNKNKD
jgi:hypothetical protein